MTKPHWSMLREPPEAGLGLWDLRLIQAGNPVWDKEHKTMNTKLGYKKGTGGFKPFLSCSLFQQFIRNVYIKLLPVCNSASPLHPRLAPAPNHPQDSHRSGKWEERAEAWALSHFGRLVSGQHIRVSISAQTSLSWNLFVYMHTRPATPVGLWNPTVQNHLLPALSRLSQDRLSILLK